MLEGSDTAHVYLGQIIQDESVELKAGCSVALPRPEDVGNTA